MTMRTCCVVGCPALIPAGIRGGRCPEHRAQARRARGNIPAYHQHRRIRARILAHAYGRACPMCGRPMHPGDDLDLDHTTPLALDARSRGDRIVHASCNRAAGGRLGSALRRGDDT